MSVTKKSLLYNYFLSQKVYLQNDIIQLQNNLRFRNYDVNDCNELAIALVKLEVFNEFTKHVSSIMDLHIKNE